MKAEGSAPAAGRERRNILILDYSVDRSETGLILKYVPSSDDCDSYFIETDDSFPPGLLSSGYTHVIHTGSSLSITQDAPFLETALSLCRAFSERQAAQMGICYGHQLMCMAFRGGSAVRRCPGGLEAGWNEVEFLDHGPVIPGVGKTERVWQSHFDEAVELPSGSDLIATSGHSRIQGFYGYELRLFGVQFHPEFDRDDGNGQFLHDRDLMEANGYDVDSMAAGGPSLDTGSTFIGFFLDHFDSTGR
jgi:GMP synthase (glutamine-hydrolysing)